MLCLSLFPDKNAGKSVAWSTDSSFVRLGKINAENEIHPLIMEGRTGGRVVSAKAKSRRDGGRSQKMERDEKREEQQQRSKRPSPEAEKRASESRQEKSNDLFRFE